MGVRGEVHMHLCGTAPVVVIDSRNQNQALTSVGETTTKYSACNIIIVESERCRDID